MGNDLLSLDTRELMSSSLENVISDNLPDADKDTVRNLSKVVVEHLVDTYAFSAGLATNEDVRIKLNDTLNIISAAEYSRMREALLSKLDAKKII